ncbi:MAG: NADH-quinone oxidoreductase subunit M [Candidatus Nanopelagicales bacterium]|nr:NADH-quinone oxidoreductase subunit M [Actinomycetota bacterium]MDC1474062.1 NADH-quinone oxidoreductase subunit M [Candidatus Nanopelagicales bacterium]MBT5502505.1 NADH-quinone oxidoreductase subunit M [Actinomycetota bacterium]MBT5807488.1 NADH-quinone oxidoreductase subunit M [Actinomycetota bacterium]MDA9017247.1 NADH-quinone oxidoreductase subunit M [Actinomycetota bacterium]
MNTYPWLTTIALLPLVGSVIVILIPKHNAGLAKTVACAFSLLTLGAVIAMALNFDANSRETFQFTESYAWIPTFGINFSFGVDGIALVLIALAATLVPVVILGGWDEGLESQGSVKGYFALILVLESLMVGVFAATDVFLFYVFFEAMLIPVYFMIGRYGGPQRSYAAVKFLIYSLVGGLFMLASLIGLYVVSAQITGTGTFDFTTLVGLDIDPDVQKLLFLGFFFAFAIKAPLWPFHTWLPDAAGQAQPGTSVLLIGVLDKVGTFGMIRYCLEIFPAASIFYAPAVISIAVIGIFYGAFVALKQTDLRRLFAYSSISHFGFIALGIFVFTSAGHTGSMVYMVAHGLSTAGLFIVAGYLMTRRGGSSQLSSFGGVNKVAPVLAGFFLIAALSSLALPGMVSFIGEFLVLLGAFQQYMWLGAVATVGIVITAAYVLRVYQKSMTGPLNPDCEGMKDLNGREITALAPIALLIIVLGVFPAPLLNVINPAVDRVMTTVGVSDPEVTFPILGESVTSEGGSE